MYADLCAAVGLVAGSSLICADSLCFAIENRFNDIIDAAEVGGLYLNHVACTVISKVLDILKGIAPFIGNDLDIDMTVIKELGDGFKSDHLLFAVLNIHGAFDAEMEGLCRFFKLCKVICHCFVIIVAEGGADSAVNVDMEYGVIALILAQRDNTVAEPFDILLEQLAMLAELGLDVVYERMRQNLCALDNHLIGIGIAIITGLGEDIEGFIGDGAAVFIRDDLAHHALSGFCDCIEDRLGNAVADSGMKTLAVNSYGLDHFGKALEAVSLFADELGLYVLFDNGYEVLSEEKGIASAGTAVLNGCAVAVCDLTVLKHEHDGNGFACLTNGMEALGHGLADIGEAVRPCSALNSTLIIEIEAGAAR